MRMRRSARSVGVLVALGGLVASGVLVSPAHAAPDLEQVRMKVWTWSQGRVCDRAVQRDLAMNSRKCGVSSMR